MAAVSEPIALALIAGVVAIVTAFIGAARTAAKPPAEPVTGKPSAYLVRLDEDDRDALGAVSTAVAVLTKAIDELRHELSRRR